MKDCKDIKDMEFSDVLSVEQTGASLEEILQRSFGCKKPFLKRKRLLFVESDGTKVYEYFTVKGAKAYEKLVDTVYALEAIGAIQDANDVIEMLDGIVGSE